MRVFTPDQYVMHSLANYPSLYASSTFDAVKFKVFDQLFNVLGNGIRDNEDVAEHFKARRYNKTRTLRFITSEPLSYGYLKVRKIGKISIPDGDSIEVVLSSEKHLHPEVKTWIDFTNDDKRSPYPNFERQYSLVWKTNFTEYGNEWIDAAIWFYTKCQEFFEGDCSSFYGAYPAKTERESTKLREDYAKFLKEYKTHADVEKAYGLPFNGDIDDFITRRWEMTRNAHLKFIKKTIKMLNKAKK